MDVVIMVATHVAHHWVAYFWLGANILSWE